MRIGIIQNTYNIVKSHYKYYDFLAEEFGHESLFYISTALFSSRTNNFTISIENLDQLERVKVVHLSASNIERFLHDKLKIFDFIFIQASNHSLVNLLIFKYCNLYNIPVIDYHPGTDLFDLYENNEQFRILKILKKLVQCSASRGELILAYKYDKKLFWFYLMYHSSYGPRGFLRPLPKEYQLAKSFVIFKNVKNHLIGIGYEPCSIDVVGPLEKALPAIKTLDKKYTLFVDSNMLFRFIPFEFFVSLATFYRSIDLGLVYAPHPAIRTFLTSSQIDKISNQATLFLNIGETLDYIHNAEIVVTHGATLSHTLLINQKKVVFLHGSKYRNDKTFKELFALQNRISLLTGTPNVDYDKHQSFVDTPFNPSLYPSVDYQKYMDEYYGQDISKINVRRTILKFMDDYTMESADG